MKKHPDREGFGARYLLAGLTAADFARTRGVLEDTATGWLKEDAKTDPRIKEHMDNTREAKQRRRDYPTAPYGVQQESSKDRFLAGFLAQGHNAEDYSKNHSQIPRSTGQQWLTEAAETNDDIKNHKKNTREAKRSGRTYPTAPYGAQQGGMQNQQPAAGAPAAGWDFSPYPPQQPAAFQQPQNPFAQWAQPTRVTAEHIEGWTDNPNPPSAYDYAASAGLEPGDFQAALADADRLQPGLQMKVNLQLNYLNDRQTASQVQASQGPSDPYPYGPGGGFAQHPPQQQAFQQPTAPIQQQYGQPPVQQQYVELRPPGFTPQHAQEASAANQRGGGPVPWQATMATYQGAGRGNTGNRRGRS